MKNLKNKQGVVLAYTLIIVSIVSIFLTASMKIVATNIQYGINRESKEEALQIAEAGVYFYRWYLAHQVAGMTKKQIRQFWNSGLAYGVGSVYEDDFNGVGRYSITVVPPESNSTIAIVTVRGWTFKTPNLIRTVKVRFRQPAWSEYVVLSDSNIRFGEDTNIIGLIHGNGGVRFDAVAHNIVSSSVATYDDPDHGGLSDEFGVHTHTDPVDPFPPSAVPIRNDVFMAGRQFPVPKKDFNSILADIADMKSEAGCNNVGSQCSGNSDGAIISSNGIYFNKKDHGRHIILQTNGTMRVSRVLNMSNNEISSQSAYVTYNIPDDGVIFVENDVWIEGAINNKKITVVAANLTGGKASDIFIKRDLVYTNYDGSDIIGLVAQRDIEITKDSEDNLKIDGVLLATNGRVGREQYHNIKNSIAIYGAIVTKQRYGFAYVNSGTNTFSEGYINRSIVFDNNLLYYPPPYFPTGTDYAIDSWEEL